MLNVFLSDFQGKEKFSCKAKEMKCKHEITLPDGEECVTLDGWLFDGIGVGQVRFKETGRICRDKPAGEPQPRTGHTDGPREDTSSAKSESWD